MTGKNIPQVMAFHIPPILPTRKRILNILTRISRPVKNEMNQIRDSNIA